MKLFHLLFALALCASLGCGKKPLPNPLHQLIQAADQAKSNNNLRQHGIGSSSSHLWEKLPPEGERVGPARRKVVYNAVIELLVEDLSAAERQLDEMIKTHQGILVQSEVNGYHGSPRFGVWQVRVPVDEFKAFKDAIAKLGEVQRSKTDSQDVSRSYSELEEQFKNLKAEADGLRELLKKPTEKLADTLTVREQLSKVTRELEGLQGRLKRMESQVDFSTLTLHIRERKDYLPSETLSFGTQLTQTFQDSAEGLVELGKGTALVTVAAAPWLPVIAVVGVPGGLLVRRRWRHRRALGEVPAVKTTPPGPA